MIRDATKEDADRLLEMGAAFFEEAGLHERGVTFDPASFLQFCGYLSQNGILLVADSKDGVVGMIGVGVVPAYWNNAVTLAQECFWWVAPEHRKGTGSALLWEMERRATAKGAILGAMVAEHGLRGDAVGRLYRAKGYAPAESTYWKRLNSVVH
jgi:GNAT superfamily N-acetyltransferase